MKKLLKLIISTMLILIMLIPALANNRSYTVNLMANSQSVWFGGYPVTRTTNYSYTSVKATTIYPTNGVSVSADCKGN